MSGGAALTALVLAGSRAGGDPLAAHAGVSHKTLIDIGGRTMIERVIAALAASPSVARIVICIERPEVLADLPGLRAPDCAKPIETMPAAAGPSASVAAALERLGTPLLIVTGDHPLLRPGWIESFLMDAPVDADVAVALSRREAVLAAVPDTQRTWLRFSDDWYSGCNVFLMRGAAARGVVGLWQRIEAERKRPVRMIVRLGVLYALRYLTGRLSLADALKRLGQLSGARLAWVDIADGRAAVDVDKPADLTLVRRLFAEAEG
ncbi:MAG: hypothetical protein K0Q76_3636 [Panacagrimonas sp.]|nr:nucleotidyltransferase family protein [Panacagrimonas sp.]MCC2658528.1 hypothetical protein [Panacagrimonas sp.]